MKSTPASATLARIPSLDGLRALSIFLVVSLHTLQRYSVSHSVGWGWYAVFNGSMGVFIFFEISGFLITSLLLQEYDRRGSVSLRGFFLRRAFRILPPLYFYIGVVVALGAFGFVALDRTDVVSSLFFFHNYPFKDSPMWALEHLWSISVEEQFYLVWPFLFVACLRRPGTAGRFTAAVIPMVVLVASPVLRVLLARQAAPVTHRFGVGLNFDFLMFGCVVALLQHTPRFEAIYRAATRVWWLPMAVMAACSVLSARYQNYFNLPVGYTLEGAAIAMFLLWSTRNPYTPVGRVLNWGPVARIGVLSYSIYLWQTLWLHHFNSQVFGSLWWLGEFPVSWVGFLVSGAFSYYVIEQPSLRLRGTVIQRLRAYKGKRLAKGGDIAVRR